MPTVTMTEKTLYDDLGVPKTASREEIKRAYRKSAQKLHPDRPGGNAEKFHQITRAYEILYDDGRRAYYDEHGKDGLQDRRGHLMQRLAQLFMQLIEQEDVDHADIITLMREALKNGKQKTQQAIRDQEKRIPKYESAKKRLKKKSSGDNLFVQMLDGQISMIKRTLENGKDELAKQDEMLEILKEYQYQADGGTAATMQGLMRMAAEESGMRWAPHGR